MIELSPCCASKARHLLNIAILKRDKVKVCYFTKYFLNGVIHQFFYMSIANMSGPHYCELGCPAKSTHFKLDKPLSPRVLGLTNMSDPRHMDFADFQVHEHWQSKHP
jgi:hypothetical protein